MLLVNQSCRIYETPETEPPSRFTSLEQPCSTSLPSSHPDSGLPLLQFWYHHVSASALQHRHQFKVPLFTSLSVRQQCDNTPRDAIPSAQHPESTVRGQSGSPEPHTLANLSIETSIHQTHIRKCAASFRAIRDLESESIVAPSSKPLPLSDETVPYKKQLLDE